LLRQGQTAFALLGVNTSETQSSIDAALTFGILWLDLCRESSAGKFLVEGLVLFVPAGSSSLVRERMANLNRAAAKWRLLEFDERHDSVIEMDCSDRGNIATRLVHATNETAALDRFDESITRIQTILQKLRCCLQPSFPSAGEGLSLREPAWGRRPSPFAAGRKLCSAWARKSAF